jgi:intein/homing endonuclease
VIYKHKYNTDIFYNEDAKSYYLLGAYITDGCIINDNNFLRTKLSSKDKDWLELINRYIAPDKPIVKRKDSDCYDLIYNCQEIALWLEEHECVQRKSLVVKMPNIPNQYMADFIRGCWDGDGSLGFTNRYRKDKNCYERCRRADITSGSKSFIESIFDYLNKIGIRSSVGTYKPRASEYKGRIICGKNNYYRIFLSNGEEVYKFCKLIYHQDNCLVMPRKQAIANLIINNWEKESRCQTCKILLHLAKTSRTTKYCNDCYKKRLKENCKKANKKYKNKLKANKNEINNS